MSVQVEAIRDLLRARFPDSLPVSYRVAGGVATGLPALDRALPGGGLPRGRLAVWEAGGGATAVLRSACVEVARQGERAAWVDGAGVVVGETWPWRGLAGPGGESGGGLELVRPAGERAALECAEELLRSGGFALVVLAGAGVVPAGSRDRSRNGSSARSGSASPGGNRNGFPGGGPDGSRTRRRGVGAGGAAAGTPGVRLAHAAREGGGAFVWVGGESPVAGLRLRSRILPNDYRWRRDPFGEPTEVEAVRVRVRVKGLGPARDVEFWLPVLRSHVRLSLESGLVDRRGAGV